MKPLPDGGCVLAIELDPFIGAALAARAAVSEVVLPERDDPIGLREFLDPGFRPSHAQAGPAPDVSSSSFHTVSQDGTAVALRLYRKAGANPGSAVVYLHGGGLICGHETGDLVARDQRVGRKPQSLHAMCTSEWQIPT